MVQAKLVNVGVDTLVLNAFYTDERGRPVKYDLDESLRLQFDAWKREAQEFHVECPTTLIFNEAVLHMAPNGVGQGQWPWMLNQTMRKQIIPERPAASHQNIFAWLTFEFGNLLVSICPPDDAYIRQPIGERIRDDDSRYGLAGPRDLPLFRRPLIRVGILSYLRPETIEQLEGNTPNKKGISSTQPFGSIGVEDLVTHHWEHDRDIVV